MLSKTLLFLLPAIAFAQIFVDIEAEEGGSGRVNLSGRIVEIIPDGERAVWRLTDSELKHAAGMHSGRRPTDVFLKSPTPWNDLYQTYGWTQVHRTITPIRGRIINMRSEPAAVIVEEYINNSTVPTEFKFNIRQEVHETASNSWTKEIQLDVGMSISYGFNIIVKKFNATTSMSYTGKWGEDHMESKTITFTAASGGIVNVVPGQQANVFMTLSRGFMEVQIDYRATLHGVAACNYYPRYEGHHFRSYNINQCLRAVNAPVSIDSSEIIRVGFYSNTSYKYKLGIQI